MDGESGGVWGSCGGGVCVWVRVVVVFVCGVLAADGESGGERILERERVFDERSESEPRDPRERGRSPIGFFLV